MDSSTLNLNIAKTETAPCSLALKIEVLPPRVQKTLRQVVADYSKQVKIPGFRAGKVPANVILKRFPNDVVEEAKKRLISNAYGDAVKSEELKVVGTPELKDEAELKLDQAEPYTFTVELETAPVFALPEYKGIELTKKAAKVDDAEIDKILEGLVERNTKFEKSDAPAAQNDMVRADYEATLPEGFEVTDKSKFILSGKNSWLILKQPEMLPGVSAALVGTTVGDERDADITFPEDHYNKEVAGKTLKYHFKINEVHTASIPELNDELAKTVGADSLEQLKTRIADNMKAQQEQMAQNAMQQQVVDFLAKSVDFQLPARLLERQKNDIAARNYQAELRKGAKKEELEPKKEAMLAEAEAEATRQLRLEFVVEAIAEAEQVTVEKHEILQAIAQFAQMQGVKFEDMLKRMAKEEQQISAVAASVRYHKTLDAVIKQATVTEVEA